MKGKQKNLSNKTKKGLDKMLELEILLHQLEETQRAFKSFEVATLDQFEYVNEELEEMLIDILNEMREVVEIKESEYQSILKDMEEGARYE